MIGLARDTLCGPAKSRFANKVDYGMFELILYVPVNNFSVIPGWVFLG